MLCAVPTEQPARSICNPCYTGNSASVDKSTPTGLSRAANREPSVILPRLRVGLIRRLIPRMRIKLSTSRGTLSRTYGHAFLADTKYLVTALRSM